jgi:hypothetical protein
MIVTTDSAETSLRLTFVVDSVTARTVDMTGPVAFEYKKPGVALKIDSSVNVAGLNASVDGVAWTFGVGKGAKRDNLILASVRFSLDTLGMLIVQASVPQGDAQMPRSTFQRFRRVETGREDLVTQDDSTRQLALAMAVTITNGFGRPSEREIAASVEKESPFTGIVLIDGHRATLEQMRGLDRRDVRRYSWLVGAVAPRYFTDPEAGKGIIAFETGQLGRR